MRRKYSNIPFERYVDDAICHRTTANQAIELWVAIKNRFTECGLELNECKMKIIYCKDDDRLGRSLNEKFDFLGYTFMARRSKNRFGKYFVNFSPAISNKAKVRITRSIRDRYLCSKTDKELEDLARIFNKVIQGWINFYSKFYTPAMYPLFQQWKHGLAPLPDPNDEAGSNNAAY